KEYNEQQKIHSIPTRRSSDLIEKYDSKNKNMYYKEIIIERTKKDKQTNEKITLKERMIVTFSPKYAAYQKNIRDSQILRAKEIIEKHPEQYTKLPQNKDRKSTRLNSSHVSISYAVFCLK